MNTQKTGFLDIKQEIELINEIKSGYLECRSFFKKYTNKDYEIHTHRKKEFLHNLCIEFYNKFNSLSQLYPVEDVKAIIDRNNFIPIQFKNGGFEYPRSFTIYIDKLKDINLTPEKDLDYGRG